MILLNSEKIAVLIIKKNNIAKGKPLYYWLSEKKIIMKTNYIICALTVLLALTGCDKDKDNDIDIDLGPLIPQENVPDEDFYKFLIEKFDRNKDGNITIEEANIVKEIDCTGTFFSSIVGIEFFANLEKLVINSPFIETLDVSSNTSLRILNCNETVIKSLDVSKCPELKELYCNNTSINTLDVSSNTLLEILDISYNNVSAIDLSKNAALKKLYCSRTNNVYITNDRISELDVSGNPFLEVLICNENALTKIDITKNTELSELNIDNNSISYLNITQNKKLKKLSCSGTQIPTLDIRNTVIENLRCVTSSLNSLNAKGSQTLKTLVCSSYANHINVSESAIESISYNPKLIYAGSSEEGIPVTILLNDCPNLKEFIFLQKRTYSRGEVEIIENGAITIDISNCKSLTKFSANYIENIKIDNCPSLKEFTCKGIFENIDLSNNTGIESIYLYGHILKSVDISSCTPLKNLYCFGLFETIDLSENINIDSLTLLAGHLTSLNIDVLSKMRYIDLALHSISSDLTFRKNNALEKVIIRDTLDNYHFYCPECSFFNLDLEGLSSLKHIEYRSAYIKDFKVSDCQNLERITSQYSDRNHEQNESITLTVKNCPSLKNIYCRAKKLTNVDISECKNLDTLDISSNRLTSFISDIDAKYFDCAYNELTSLDISGSTAIKELNCESNNIQNLSINGCSNLEIINCANNKISSIPANNHLKLIELYCNDNRLTSLDISENQSMDKINCSGNSGLNQLFINNSQNFSVFKIGNNTEVIYK